MQTGVAGGLTDYVEQGEKLAEVVSVRPPIVVAKILPKIVQEHLLLRLLLPLGTESDVEVHHKSVNLAALPTLPQPSRRVEKYRLKGADKGRIKKVIAICTKKRSDQLSKDKESRKLRSPSRLAVWLAIPLGASNAVFIYYPVQSAYQ